MPKFLSDILAILCVLVPFLVAAERAGDGPAKKAEVLARIKATLAEPGGLDWPKFFPIALQDWFLGLLIDVLVGMLNRSGFFGQ